jgi:hypothetical protein
MMTACAGALKTGLLAPTSPQFSSAAQAKCFPGLQFLPLCLMPLCIMLFGCMASQRYWQLVCSPAWAGPVTWGVHMGHMGWPSHTGLFELAVLIELSHLTD